MSNSMIFNTKILQDSVMSGENQSRYLTIRKTPANPPRTNVAWEAVKLDMAQIASRRAQNAATLDKALDVITAIAIATGQTENEQTVSPAGTAASETTKGAVAAAGAGEAVSAETVTANVANLIDRVDPGYRQRAGHQHFGSHCRNSAGSGHHGRRSVHSPPRRRPLLREANRLPAKGKKHELVIGAENHRQGSEGRCRMARRRSENRGQADRALDPPLAPLLTALENLLAKVDPQNQTPALVQSIATALAAVPASALPAVISAIEKALATPTTPASAPAPASS